MGRKFIAVVPKDLSANGELRQLMSKLKRTMSDRRQEARWTAADLWHVTVQFLGDLPSGGGASERLKQLLENWNPAVSELSLRLHGLGAFPSPEEARVLWIGVQESQDFLKLQEDLSSRLLAAGFSLGDREFKPHLTLARFRNTINADDLVKLGGRKHFGDYAIGELVLFESVLQGNILKYVPILRKKL